jgi:hypothetical protein
MKLPRLKIHPRKMEGFNGKKMCITIDFVVYADFDIDDFERKFFFILFPVKNTILFWENHGCRIMKLLWTRRKMFFPSKVLI